MGNGKRIKAQTPKHGTRIQSPTVPAVNHYKQPPHFSLEFLSAAYCLSACTTDERAAFADAIHKRSQMTWEQIVMAPRLGLGQELINRDAIGAAIPSCFTNDERVIALRFCGKAPMVGIRRERVFYILWLDREFKLYDHGS